MIGRSGSEAPLPWLRWAVVVVSVGEMATGFALVLVPEAVMAGMDVGAPPPGAAVFVRWIGVFIVAVGAAYLTPWLSGGSERWARLRGAIAWTAGARFLVAVFVAVAMIDGDLSAGWSVVAGYDALLAAAQVVALSKGALGRAL